MNQVKSGRGLNLCNSDTAMLSTMSVVPDWYLGYMGNPEMTAAIHIFLLSALVALHLTKEYLQCLP